jgi:hypothetical protein
MRKGYRLEFVQEESKNPAKVILVLYPTARSILVEFAEGTEIYDKKGLVEGHMPDGTMWRHPLEDAIKHIQKRGAWGFYRFNDKEIHMWFRKNVKEKKLQTVLAHEMGHWMEPHHRKLSKEEVKAMKYEFVSAFSHDVTNHLLEAVKEGALK